MAMDLPVRIGKPGARHARTNQWQQMTRQLCPQLNKITTSPVRGLRLAARRAPRRRRDVGDPAQLAKSNKRSDSRQRSVPTSRGRR